MIEDWYAFTQAEVRNKTHQNMCNMHNMQNMQNMQNMTSFSWPIVLLQHRNIGTLMLLHPIVRHCTDFEQEQNLAEPDVSHPQLESAVWDARRANKHHVLAIGLPQFLYYKWPRWDAHFTWEFCMPYHEGRVKDNMPCIGVGQMNAQSVQKSPVLSRIQFKYAPYA
jgi:hypothetical protein